VKGRDPRKVNVTEVIQSAIYHLIERTENALVLNRWHAEDIAENLSMPAPRSLFTHSPLV
jgi:hypothetical protein